MKKVILIMVSMLLTGCSQLDGVYGVGKAIVPNVPIPEQTKTVLKVYDNVRTEVREQQELKKNNASTLEVSNP